MFYNLAFINMNLDQLQQKYISSLASVYHSNDEIKSIFHHLVFFYLNYDTTAFLLQRQELLPQKKISLFQEALLRLQNNEPVQHITGKAFFCQKIFWVSSSVLIPRQETEELVNWILSDTTAYANTPLRILDLCTGSGCIAISLADYFQKASVTAIDICPDALDIAQKNIETHGVEVSLKNLNLLNTDINEIKNDFKNLDIIVANPPYVRQQEKFEIPKNVLGKDPDLALFVENNDPLIFYQKIMEWAFLIKPKLGLYLEINEYLGQETLELINQFDCESVILSKDLFGKDRMIKVNFYV